MAKSRGTLYFIWKLIGNEYKFQFRMYESSPNNVRIYLAERGYEGDFAWKSEKGKKWYYAKFVK